jgi:flagellar motor switch protein FliG
MASQLSGQEKSAILLSLIGEEAAAEILKSLDMHDVGKITTQMSRLKTIKRDTADTVLKEITGIIARDDIQFVAGDQYIKKVLSKGFGEEDASKVLERALKDAPFDSLRWVDPWALANILMGEHPQTVAFILCLLEPVRAAEVLALFGEDLRANVAMRIAVTERTPETAIEEIRDVFDHPAELGVSAAGTKLGALKTIAEILNHSDRFAEEAVFMKLEVRDKTLAVSTRELM